MCVPQRGGAGITENAAAWLCKRACCLRVGSAGGWMEAGGEYGNSLGC